MSCGIYKIQGPRGKLYVGQSANVEYRLEVHFVKLKENRHPNRHLQNSYNKHGAIKFSGLLLEHCSIAALNEREHYYAAVNHGRLYNQYPLPKPKDPSVKRR